MPKSKNLEFSFLESAQAQKHLTVNQAMLTLDAMLGLKYLEAHQPLPEEPMDGECFAISDRRNLHFGKIALASGGGYKYINAKSGFSAQHVNGMTFVYNGFDWLPQLGYVVRAGEIDFKKNIDFYIPKNTSVVGITARVTQEINGVDMKSWSLGVAEDTSRYGYGFWPGKNGWGRGLTGAPMTYWNDTKVTISPDEGVITSGALKLYMYICDLVVPDEV